MAGDTVTDMNLSAAARACLYADAFCCVNSHDIQHRVIPQDFVRDINTQVQASICALDTSWVAWPNLESRKTGRLVNETALPDFSRYPLMLQQISRLTGVFQEWLRFLDHNGFCLPALVQWFSSPLKKREEHCVVSCNLNFLYNGEGTRWETIIAV